VSVPSPTVAVSFRMFGPYILARLGAAAKAMTLIALEGSRISTVYAWEPRAGEAHLDRRTLFTGKAIETASPAEIEATVRKALDEAAPDVVVIPGWSFPEALAMLAWAGEHGRPAVVLSESTRHDHSRNPVREAIKRQVIRQCSAALVGGPMHRAYLAQLGMTEARVFLGYDAVDNAFFMEKSDGARKRAKTLRKELGLPENYFLLSNRFISIKNLPRFLNAYAAYRAAAGADAWHVVMLGDGEERAALEIQTTALGLTDYVRYPGFKQYDDLPTYYALAGAFVHVSTVEPWGLVVNEAAASGLPVIVSDRCGCVETLLEDGANGFVIDPWDTASITSALARLSATPAAEREAMGRRSREIVESWGPQTFATGLRAAVDHALAHPVKPAGPLARLLLRLLSRRPPARS